MNFVQKPRDEDEGDACENPCGREELEVAVDDQQGGKHGGQRTSINWTQPSLPMSRMHECAASCRKDGL